MLVPKLRHYSCRILIFLICLSLLVPAFAAQAQTPGTPSPSAPGNGTVTTVVNYPPLGIPVVSWTPVPGATQYRVQFSRDAGFSGWPPINVTTDNTSYTPLDLTSTVLQDGEWYWRVKVERPSGGEYSQASLFIKNWASENAPQLVSPAPDATIDFYGGTTFSWAPVKGAAAYRFEISASLDNFATPLYYATNIVPTSHQPNAKMADNNALYWRVIPLDPGGNQGAPSEVREFSQSYGSPAYSPQDIPALLAPADFSTPEFTPTFRWKAVRGVQSYTLQYTSAPGCNFNAPGTISIPTRNTTYTPIVALPNDTNYCWRVRAVSGSSTSEWSDTWEFVKKWYIQPQLLTPNNNYQYVRYPILSWTPVPGAARYKVEVNNQNSFPPGWQGWTEHTANTTYNKPDRALSHAHPTDDQWYWRVTPVDFNNNEGMPSDVFSFRGIQGQPHVSNFPAPQLIYPLYYYNPDPPLQPYFEYEKEDRTVPLPVFTWHRTLSGTNQWEVNAYRIQIASSPHFPIILWEYDTENLSAAPLMGQFNPAPGGIYYWRVCALNMKGGNCLIDTATNQPMWSQVWKSRIDTTKGLTPTVGPAPTLLRPIHSSESVESFPLLEWWPLQGASQYQVQISIDPGFASQHIVDNAVVDYPVYTPTEKLSYYPGTGTGLPYGTYYWRVRSTTAGSPWSNPWRFQVAAQSHWVQTRTLGVEANKHLIGYDTPGDASEPYDLTSLYAVQSASAWHFGFEGHPLDGNTAYVLYLDLDHKDGFGGSSDPRGYSVSTITPHMPEYAVYILATAPTYSFDANNVLIYRWTGSNWAPPVTLLSVGGQIHPTSTLHNIDENLGEESRMLDPLDPNGALCEEKHQTNPLHREGRICEENLQKDLLYQDDIVFEENPQADSLYIELRIPNTAIGMEAVTGSAVVSLFSVNTSTGQVQDSVPSGNHTLLNRFASVSEKMSPAQPLTNISGDPSTYPSVLPFFWHWPNAAHWAAYRVEVARDPAFTTVNYSYTLTSSVAYLAAPLNTPLWDLIGDNTYYWRVRPQYLSSGGAWSEPVRFERKGFVPQDPKISVSFATPTFSWDTVEGAEAYVLQVSANSGFSSTVVNVTTPNTSYTPTDTLANGTYYYRVLARRYNNIQGQWSTTQTFSLNLPTPTYTSLTPNDPAQATIFPRTPTLCWDHLLVSHQGIPILAAWKYRVQVSRTAAFSTIYDNIDTEQRCWTPTKGYDDGTYYWRVAMIDGQGKLGEYTPPAQFYKQYGITTKVRPAHGATISGEPEFVWTPVDGAAKYRLEVSENPSFSPTFEAITTVNTRYTGVKAYDVSKPYFWRVAIIDRDNKQGPFTDVALLASNRLFLPLITR
jgi:hypothetical protein